MERRKKYRGAVNERWVSTAGLRVRWALRSLSPVRATTAGNSPQALSTLVTSAAAEATEIACAASHHCETRRQLKEPSTDRGPNRCNHGADHGLKDKNKLYSILSTAQWQLRMRVYAKYHRF
jgi:hypothetical protein